MNKFCLSLLAILSLSAPLSAELIFHEPFDFGPGVTTLGFENGWQADFNRDDPSSASITPRHTQEASPFSQTGLALQLGSSRDVSYRQLPQSLNGKNVFFSYSTKLFVDKGAAFMWFRASDGFPVKTGMINGNFVMANGGTEVFGQAMVAKKSYFIVGQLETSVDGRGVVVAASIYESADAVPSSAPATDGDWALSNARTYLKERDWDGVGFWVGSSNAAFDDLRIGTTWEDVTGKSAPGQ